MNNPEIQTAVAEQTLRAIGRKSNGNRRSSVCLIALVAVFTLTILPLAFAGVQDQWRYCSKCHVMFYNGFPDKGHCAAGGGHFAQGFNFILPHDVAETKKAQAAWRFCDKCHAMFFDGYSQKGACAAGGGHHAQGFLFVLPHDVPPSGVVQKDWRYCEKCHAMFFNGFANKGRCPAMGGHTAQGFNFVLRYEGNLENDVHLNPVDE
jgi:cytochrome c5